MENEHIVQEPDTYAVTHTHTHTYTHTYSHTHTYTHTYSHTHTHKHTHTHTHINVHIHTHIHTHTYILTHTHTHTHTHRHAHAHTYIHMPHAYTLTFSIHVLSIFSFLMFRHRTTRRPIFVITYVRALSCTYTCTCISRYLRLNDSTYLNIMSHCIT